MASLSIPIAKGGASIDVETDALPEAMYALALAEGLKVLLNKRMSKVGSVTKLDGEEKAKAHADAMKIANENFNDLMAGKLKTGRATSETKVAGVVMTEARRLAKEVVKNTIREAGMKVSHVEASAITAAANELLKSDPSFIEQATANIEARKAKTATDSAQAKAALQALGGVAESPKLVAAAEKAAAEKKANAPLSAKQAGMVKAAPRKSSETHVH